VILLSCKKNMIAEKINSCGKNFADRKKDDYQKRILP
jgi:hypothetical protein